MSAEIRPCKYFSLMADQAVDISNKNLPWTIRFVDVAKNIRQELVGCHPCEEGTNGEAMGREWKRRLEIHNFCIRS